MRFIERVQRIVLAILISGSVMIAGLCVWLISQPMEDRWGASGVIFVTGSLAVVLGVVSVALFLVCADRRRLRRTLERESAEHRLTASRFRILADHVSDFCWITTPERYLGVYPIALSVAYSPSMFAMSVERI